MKITGVISENNPDYSKHRRIFEMCMKEEVDLPEQTKKFFGNDVDHDDCLERALQIELEAGVHYNDKGKYVELIMTAIPKHFVKIRIEQ